MRTRSARCPLRLPAPAVLLAAVLATAPPLRAQPTVLADEAGDHVGRRATVCGDVVSAHHAEARAGAPTFLNLDRPYPDQVFEIIIWEEHRPVFIERLGEAPEVRYRDKYLCIEGEVGAYRGVPRIEAAGPDQIRLGAATLVDPRGSCASGFSRTTGRSLVSAAE